MEKSAVCWVAGRAREALADIDEAITYAGQNYEIGRETVGFSTAIWSRSFRGFLLADLGRLAEARDDMATGARLAREHDDVETLGWAEGGLGSLELYTGERGDGLAHVRRGVDIADRLGSSFSRLVAYFSLAVVYLAHEEPAEALAAAEEGLDVMRSTRTGLQYEAHTLAIAARAQYELGDVAAAIDAATRGLSIARAQGLPPPQASCHLILGRALSADEPTRARAELEQALEVAGDDMPVLHPQVREALGELAGMHGREDARVRQFELAVSLYEQHGATGHARRLAAALAAAGA